MPQRTPVAAGNWKMNTTPSEGAALCRELAAQLHGLSGVEVVVCPPFTHLAAAQEILAASGIGLGAQNLSAEPKGAFTGEVSATMIAELAGYVIIGHSERRQYFGEDDRLVCRKLSTALSAGLIPIVCVGETLEERDADRVSEVLTRQVHGAFEGLELTPRVIVAYEPVWAIGTGRAANAAQADEAMGLVRRVLADIGSAAVAGQVRILYGGSMNADNVGEFMTAENVDGGLVGGASLQASSFAAIVRAIAAARRQ